MNLNKLLKNSNSTLTIIIVIGILIVVNFFAYQIFYRFDLTQNKDYSISKVSKKTVGQLDDIVNVKVYFSDNLPSQYINLRQEVGDILDEYANYSGGKIHIEFVDPSDDKDLQQKLYLKGIPELQFNVLEKDKYQVVNGYLGMAVEYGDKTEAIPVVENTRNLEYDITLAIKKATSQVKPAVGYVKSNSTLKPDSEITVVYKRLQEIYDVREIDLSAEETPVDIKTLIIAGPKEKFGEKALKEIDKFLMQGGSLLVLVDGVKVGDGLVASANETELDGLLEKYGVKLNHDLVLDVSSGIASFNQGFVTFSTNYPFWPKIISAGFDKENVSVAKLEGVIMPWASSLDILTDKIAQDNKISYLMKTTENSWTQEENYNLNPQQMYAGVKNTGSKTLAVSIFGKFKSAYGDASADSGRLIVAGDSDFLSDGFARQAPDNIILFQNLVDSLSLGEDLISIRSKGITERPIKQMEEGKKAIIRYSNIFGLTLVVVAFGLIRYFLRRRARFEDEM